MTQKLFEILLLFELVELGSLFAKLTIQYNGQLF